MDELQKYYEYLKKAGADVPPNFDSFKNTLSNEESSKKYYDYLKSNKFDTPDSYDSFASTFGLKKKSGGQESASAGQSTLQNNYAPESPFGSEIPDATRQSFETEDPITLSKKSKQLRTPKVTTSGGAGAMTFGGGASTTYTDENDILEADRIDKHLKTLGYDSQELNDRIEGIPENVYDMPGTSKQDFLDLYKNNKLNFNRLTATIKGQQKFLEGIDAQYEAGNITDENKDTFKHNFIQAMNLVHSTTDLNEQRRHIGRVVEMVDLYGGENKDDIKRNLGEDFEFTFGRLAGDDNFILDNAGGKLNSNQAAAFEYIKTFKPEELRRYSTALMDESQFKDNYEAKLGIQQSKKQLEELGIYLRKKYLQEELAPIEKKYQYYINKQQTEGLTPEEALDAQSIGEKGLKLNESLDMVNEDFRTIPEKYPSAAYYEANNFAQELFGQKNSSYGGLEHFMTTVGKSVENTRLGVYDMVSEPFRSDSESQLRAAEVIGSGVTNDNVNYTIQSNRMGKLNKPVLSEGLQKEVDEINNDKSLSDDEKIKKGTQLLLSRVGEWQLEPTGKSNTSLKALYYGVGDMAANLVPFIGLEMLTGGGATAGAIRKFTSSFVAATATGFEETYRMALEKVVKDPYAYATRVTMINAAAISGAGTADKIKAIFSKQNTPIAKIITQMDDDAIEAMLKESPKAFSSIKNTVEALKKGAANTAKSVFKDVKDAAKINAYMSGGQIVNDAIDGELKPAGEYIYDAAIETLKFATFSVTSKAAKKVVSKPSDMSLSILYDAAQNKEKLFSVLDKKIEQREIEPEEAAQIRKNVETTSKIINENSIIFKSLNDGAKREYIRNAITARQAAENAKGFPDNVAKKFDMEAAVATYKNGFLVEPKTPEQLAKRKEQLEKELVPETDADGKAKEILPAKKMAAEAEIKAIDEVLEELQAYTPLQVAEKLLEPHKNSGMFMGMQTAEQKIKFIAEQAHGVMQDGSLHKSGGQRVAMDAAFGKEVVDAAIEAFPKETLVKEQKIETSEITTEQKIKELEVARDTEIAPLDKPEIIKDENEITTRELAKLPREEIKKYGELSKRKDLLTKLIDCLWR